MKWFDTHTHPNLEPLLPEFAAIYQQCQKESVLFNVVGTTLEDSQIAFAQAQNAGVFCTIGIHPNDVAKYDLNEARATLEKMLQQDVNNRIVAIGECGFDFHYTGQEQYAVQKAFFQMQISLAIKYNRALMCHIRDAHAAAINLLRDFRAPRTIIHCFTADLATAQQYLSLGCYLSIPGVVTFKSARDLQAAVQQLPADRILLETDAPFLAPAPHRGKTNYPVYVKDTFRFLTELRSEDPEQLAAQLFNNALSVFNLKEGVCLNKTK